MRCEDTEKIDWERELYSGINRQLDVVVIDNSLRYIEDCWFWSVISNSVNLNNWLSKCSYCSTKQIYQTYCYQLIPGHQCSYVVECLSFEIFPVFLNQQHKMVKICSLKLKNKIEPLHLMGEGDDVLLE